MKSWSSMCKSGDIIKWYNESFWKHVCPATLKSHFLPFHADYRAIQKTWFLRRKYSVWRAIEESTEPEQLPKFYETLQVGLIWKSIFLWFSMEHFGMWIAYSFSF